MRLGQLARKLAVRPSQIVDFLSTKQIHLDEGSNARLEDSHLSVIVNYFAPERLNEILNINAEETAPVTDTIEVILPVETIEVIEETPLPEPLANIVEQKIEVIKAPKVELTGLKVLGKIDLPEPKKKEVTLKDQPTEEQPAEEKVKSRASVKRNNARDRQPSEKPWKNPIAQQREREVREAEEKRREALEREKEKRRQHYLGKVKTSQPTKAARLYEEQAEETVRQEVKPKTLWGKFIKWLNN